MTRILILGGTSEAVVISHGLIGRGHDVTTSLAGVTTNPILPAGRLRTGGFGGAEGLRSYLAEQAIDVLIDATHPYAAVISRNACDATVTGRTRLIRYERAPWTPQKGDRWIPVATLTEAAAALPPRARVFLTTGRKDLAPFVARTDMSAVVRTIEPPAEKLPPQWSVLLDRPPHDLASERALMRHHAITHLVTKNAGSEATRAKLDAARELGITVVMVARPQKPPCTTFHSVESLLAQF